VEEEELFVGELPILVIDGKFFEKNYFLDFIFKALLDTNQK